MLARLDFVRQRLGQSGFLQLLAALSAEDATVIGGAVLTAVWYPLPLILRLDAAIAGLLNPQNPDAVFIEMGEASAASNLSNHHASFLSPGDPQRFLGASPQIYRVYYDTGRRTYERLGEHSGVVRTYDAESVTPADCLTVIGWYQQGLRMCGAVDPHGTHPLCRATGGAHCEYVFEWKDTTRSSP